MAGFHVSYEDSLLFIMLMIWLKRIFYLVLFLVCLGFGAYILLISLRNDALVNFDLFFIQLQQVPIEVLVIGAFLLGGLLGVASWLIPAPLKALKNKRKINQAKKELI
ncbi:Uncharacterised protein [BD1-7 clade bacterium]|uniref:Lipopolysaccharide assembly protein A domain-containing protein n=1 Tax=BD1-7 clade bacterium TaxID=2029982 RepID=A0A5S9P9Y2_9GAMM|nr:Uncharacterised protein [BD1-7 clade bacterium]